jgi:putative nucleotidyltransferase with HDIG domain
MAKMPNLNCYTRPPMPSSREDAWAILNEFTKNPSLIKHALGVESAMRSYAPKYGGNPDTWGVVGLLHDYDYERYPEVGEHAVKGAAILKERGWPEEIWYAVLSHADYANAPRTTPMQKVLYAVDELVGFVAAVALVRPTKSVAEVDVAAVKKKFKDKAFARAVHREQIFSGAEQLGVDLDQHIQVVIDAMKANAAPLGLAGTPA